MKDKFIDAKPKLSRSELKGDLAMKNDDRKR